MEMVFATGNRGKVKDAIDVLSRYGIRIIQKKISFPEPRSWDPIEIALEKAKFAARIINKPLMVEDSGFFIPSLNGFPATYANFVLETIGIEGLLKLLEGKNRYCEFRGVLAYWEAGLEPVIFENICKGIVSHEAWDKLPDHSWSPLNLIFVPEGFDEPLANEEVNKRFHEQWYETSHFKQLGEWLGKRDQDDRS